MRRRALRAPLLAFSVPAALAIAFLVLPLVALVAGVSWSDLAASLASNDVLTSLRLSMECSLLTVAVSMLFGVPLAFVLARWRMPGRGVIRAAVLMPIVVPPVAGGIALQAALGRATPFGRFLHDVFGVVLPFSTAGAVIAETFVAMPFLVLAVEAALRQRDDRMEEAAATLGAGAWRRFSSVTLPLLVPSLAAGAALCWARALGEFGATITFAGNFPGTTQTLPLAAYTSFAGSGATGRAITIAVLLLLVAAALVLGVRGGAALLPR